MSFEFQQVAIEVIGKYPMTRNHSWRERLLTWPWRPWVKTVPSAHAILLDCIEYAEQKMRENVSTSVFH